MTLASSATYRSFLEEMDASTCPVGVTILGVVHLFAAVLVVADYLAARSAITEKAVSFMDAVPAKGIGGFATILSLAIALYSVFIGIGFLRRREWALSLYTYVPPSFAIIGLLVALIRGVWSHDPFQQTISWSPLFNSIGYAMLRLLAWGAILYYLNRPKVIRCFR